MTPRKKLTMNRMDGGRAMLRKQFLMILLSLLCLFAHAAAEPNSPSEFAYLVHDDHVEILAYTGTQATVEVPAQIEGKPVTKVRLGCSYYGDQGDLFLYVRKVILPSTVTTLSDFAFGRYSLLETVEGLEYVQRVEGEAFWGSGLKEARFSDALQSVAYNAFSSAGVHTLTLPDDVAYDSGLSLPGVENLMLIDGSDSPTIMVKDELLISSDGTKLLSVLSSMRDVRFTIPDGVTTICWGAMNALNFVDEIVFPRSVTTVSGITVEPGTTLFVYAGSPMEEIARKEMEIYDVSYSLVVMEDEGEASVDSLVEGIIRETITPGMSDVQKAKALHDWIVDNGSYDYTYSNFNASYILSGNAGVCDAYTRAYCILLDAVGISSRREECVMNGVAHAITSVQLNGKWYLVDCTNDDEGFGYPDALFCFDQAVYDQFYSGPLSVQANSIDLYAPYTSGKMDYIISPLSVQVQQQLDLGQTIFTVSPDDAANVDPIYGQAVCSIVESMQWDVGGEMRTLECTLLPDSSYQCILPDKENDYAYYETDGGVCLTSYLGSEAHVIVPETYRGLPVVAMRETFYKNTGLRSVVLPAGLKEIGANTFNGCTNLSGVSIPAGVEAIGSYAFGECIALAGKVVLPEGLKTLESFAFAHCLGITEINLPAGVTVPGAAVFAECINLEQVTLATGLTTISDSMFYGCTSLRDVDIPHTVTMIDHGAFISSGLICIDIPANVSMVAWDAFINADSLQQLTVHRANQHYAAAGNILYSKDMKTLLVSTPAIGAHLQIADSVEVIGRCAFAMNSTLISVHVSSTVKSIEEYAFLKSTLEHVYIEDGLTSIGSHAFAGNGCSTENVLRIAYGGASGLMSIRLPNTLTHLGEGALYGHHYFTTLVLPSSLTRIDVPFIDAPITLRIPAAATYIAPQPVVQDGWQDYRVEGAAGSYAEVFAAEAGCTFIDTTLQLTLSSRKVALLMQESTQLSVIAADGDGALPDNNDVTWHSSSDCVRVENGVLTGVAAGEATITATWNGQTGTCTVTVPSLIPGSLHFEYGKTVLRNGEGTNIRAYVHYHASETAISQYDVFRHGTWTLSDDGIITIADSTVVQAIGVGTCTATFTLPDGESLSVDFVVVGTPSPSQSTLKLPRALETIGVEAFAGMQGAIVIIPDGCREIQSRAFADNPDLQYVYIPASVTAIADDAFEGCPDVFIATRSEYALLYSESKGIPAGSIE